MTRISEDAVLLNLEGGGVRWYCWRHPGNDGDAFDEHPARGEVTASRFAATLNLRRHLLRAHDIDAPRPSRGHQLGFQETAPAHRRRKGE